MRPVGRQHTPAHQPPEDSLITEQGEHFSPRAISAAAARLAGKDDQVKNIEREEPLQRRVLEALAESGGTPTELAKRVAAPKESVTRQLRQLRELGMVCYSDVPGDKRKRHYSLTLSGEIQLSQHRAFGAAIAPPDEPTDHEVASFLLTALHAAVALRRKTNKLDDVIVRLNRIVTQARTANTHDVALEATAELVTTLRQAHRYERAREVLVEVDQISHGLEPHAGTAVVPAAIAHREYALGLIASRERKRAAGVKHLVFASELYEQFAELPPYGVPADWRERQAWSLIGLANNLRAQSQFEPAMRASGEALRLFEELDDHYGRSRCLFTFGFCLRLLGDYSNAWVYLDDSHSLATQHGFERFQADSLMQMGEVRRCQGRLEEAVELLTESQQRAKHLKFTVTQAFALSALGAVHYQCRDLERSARVLEQAQRLFEHNRHPEGAALNARRRATVAARRLARVEAERSEVAGLVADAYRRYTAIHCPAGVVAAEIEEGYLEITERGDPREVASRLATLLLDPRQRVLIEYDVWVPRVLHSFASRVGEGTLLKRAAELVQSAQRRAQEARTAIRETIAAIGAGTAQIESNPITPSPEITCVDEMGGESRHLVSVGVGESICL